LDRQISVLATLMHLLQAERSLRKTISWEWLSFTKPMTTFMGDRQSELAATDRHLKAG
jgi:hypothetical protein